jgi:hypothetical protein
MRKTMFWLLSTFLFLALPALAQHPGGGGGHSGGGHSGGSHGGSAHASAPHGGGGHSGGQRSGRGNAQREVPHQGYHYAQGNARDHWRGGRFDRDYFVGHWGYGNRFWWGRCNWWGRPYWVGSYFWFNDGYFEIVDVVPVDWYDGEVYVDEYDGGYYLMNPDFPGVRILVRVRF